MNRLDLLPDDLQDVIYKEVHRVKFDDVLEEIKDYHSAKIKNLQFVFKYSQYIDEYLKIEYGTTRCLIDTYMVDGYLEDIKPSKFKAFIYSLDRNPFEKEIILIYCRKIYDVIQLLKVCEGNYSLFDVVYFDSLKPNTNMTWFEYICKTERDIMNARRFGTVNSILFV